MLSLAHRLAARLDELDQWDDGGSFILDHHLGGDIKSFTGVHGWNAGAGHEPPPPDDLLRAVRDEVVTIFDGLPREIGLNLSQAFRAKVSSFDAQPSMLALIELAGVVDPVHPLFVGNKRPDSIELGDDMESHGYGGYDEE